jgi:anti-sigma factor RsiW
MLAETTEFQISQYIDGTLSAAERSTVESVLAADAEARKVLADYRHLNQQLAASQSIPAVNWDRLSTAISDSIEPAERPMVAGRIGFGSARMRIAAAVLVAATAAIVARHYTYHAPVISTPTHETDVAVTGPSAEPPAGPAMVEISVSPSATAMRNDPAHYAQLNRPSRVAISPVTPPAKNASH